MILASPHDTTVEMADTFIEEFLRLGYGPEHVLALFRNPHYLGPRLVLQRRGEPFVRERIAEVFARWGRPLPAEGAAGPNGLVVDGRQAPRQAAACDAQPPTP